MEIGRFVPPKFNDYGEQWEEPKKFLGVNFRETWDYQTKSGPLSRAASDEEKKKIYAEVASRYPREYDATHGYAAATGLEAFKTYLDKFPSQEEKNAAIETYERTNKVSGLAGVMKYHDVILDALIRSAKEDEEELS